MKLKAIRQNWPDDRYYMVCFEDNRSLGDLTEEEAKEVVRKFNEYDKLKKQLVEKDKLIEKLSNLLNNTKDFLVHLDKVDYSKPKAQVLMPELKCMLIEASKKMLQEVERIETESQI